MSTTTMHFGPEWMRTKHQSASRIQPPPSPPPASVPATSASTYSSLVSATPATQSESKDEAHPFRYSKEEMLRIYKEGGGKVGLGLEVERWEGVVREVGTDPVGLREMDEAERKLFTSPLNSDLRRRQSNDYLHLNMQNLDRPRLNHVTSGSATGSPLRERYSGLMSRRRDSTDQPPLTPRKLSLTGQTPLMSPRDTGLPSPRGRLGHASGFDGVLNSGDSWVARRRASEGLAKTTVGSTRELDKESNGLKIREEEKNHSESDPKPNPQHDSSDGNSSTAGGIAAHRPETVETGMAQLSVEAPNNQNISNPSPSAKSAALGPPPGLVDLASVEWSYLDPQGQVQGPFRADLMQKWHDDGYFVPELLMKRATLDTEWIPVGELARRAGGGKIFLTPIPPSIPPGLTRRTESPFSFSTDPNGFVNGPYQPSPVRSLRSTTLESYLSTGSNHSDSPASSFGAGRFGNGSPDPSAFGGRANQYAVGEIGGRLGYSLAGGEASPALSGRGAPFGTPPVEFRSPAFGNVIQGRAGSLDTGYGMNGGFGSPVSPWPASTTASTFDVLNAGRGLTDSISYQTGFNGLGATNGTSVIDTPDTNGFHGSFGTPGEQQTLAARNLGGMAYPDPSSPATQFAAPQQVPSTVPDVLEQQASRNQMTNQSVLSATENVTSSPWGAVDSPANKRPGAFDRNYPTSSNTVASQSLPWAHNERVSQTSSQTNEPSPWLPVSQGLTDNWKEEPERISLIDNNLGKYDQQLQLEAVQPVPSVTAEALPEAEPLVLTSEAVIQPEPAPAPAPKGRTKSVSHNVQPQPQVSSKAPVAPETAPIVPEPQQAQVPPKAAWAKEDDSKKTAATSLRKIQDAEAKKAEARKAAEREKERAARATASPTSTEDIQPFTASWGLPTSQAGKSTTSAQPKESTASPTQPAVPAPAVWTNAAKPPATKKTMKEIQEEEERRKKAAVKETVANVAARRGYAESTTKAPPAPSLGNAWTTVGPSGKAVPGASAPNRPPAMPSTSTANSSSTTRVNGAVHAARSAPAPMAKAPSNGPKVDDFPVAPSHEFLKWLNDSLKGLNNTVNVEEIMSMLLSFPLDPDSSTTEIISEMIYANSTTLDGRRFASDFINRRKADAATRSKNGAGAGSGKPISIADVVKAQPKPQSPSEWGGFKVVNKKKKGGRS